MAEVIPIAVGFILTTVAGGWWASRLQQRSWERQNEVRLKEEEVRRATALCDELTRLLDKRLYRMGRLCWAVAALQQGHLSSEVVEARFQDYNDVLYEWNDRLNANLALLDTHFGAWARDYLFHLYEHFRGVGGEIESQLRRLRRGEDVSAAVDAILPEFEGWSTGSLNARVYEFGRGMTAQLRDGRVGRSAFGPEYAPSPQLQQPSTPWSLD